MPSRLCLPQDAYLDQRRVRARTLFAQREAYQWVQAPGQPPFCRGVPSGEAFAKGKALRLKLDMAESVADLALAAVVRLGGHNDTIASFRRYYILRKLPEVANRWRTDKEFARQRLDGINPMLIEQVRQIPEHFPVTEDMFRGLLPSGSSLEALRAQGRLFMMDYKAIAGLPVVMGRFQTAPIALFWVNDRGALMPLAIQLGQSPAHAPVIFTPGDDEWLWLTARTHLQCADGTYHENITHLARTHLFMETFWVAACRTLPSQHPVYELLHPHFTGTVEINYEARNTLIVPGGPIDESIAVGSEGSLTLVARDYANWTFDDFDPLKQIESRGAGDRTLLPNYHYRDDALALFEIIGSYVNELLRIYYPDDETVRGDHEIQSWVRELVEAGGWRDRGLPLQDDGVQTFDDLHAIISRVIYVGSVQHSAVNNGQYEQFGYIPNTPGAMYLPPPTDRSRRSEANFVYALPTPHAVGEQLTLAHLLSQETDIPLGNYPEGFFQGEPEAQAVVDRLRADLSQAGYDIRARNNALKARGDVPYVYLEPHRVSRSIGV